MGILDFLRVPNMDQGVVEYKNTEELFFGRPTGNIRGMCRQHCRWGRLKES